MKCSEETSDRVHADEEIERIVAVNVAAFADGELHLLQSMCATQLNTIIDEFNRILVGGDISILPLLMRAQIRAGLIGGEVPSATSSRVSSQF